MQAILNANFDNLESFLMNTFGCSNNFLLEMQLLALAQTELAIRNNKDVVKILSEDFLPEFVNTEIPYEDEDKYIQYYLLLYTNYKAMIYFEDINRRLGTNGLRSTICTRSRSKLYDKLRDLKWIVENVAYWDDYHK
jgi:hypothetical protein